MIIKVRISFSLREIAGNESTVRCTQTGSEADTTTAVYKIHVFFTHHPAT